MKSSVLVAALFGLIPAALAQEAGPSPTESYGCEPHGDHYHCEGARATLSTQVKASSGASSRASAYTTIYHTDKEDHDHDDHTDSHSHSHAAGTAEAGPSPTESYGCEPHGDHYHCEGARATLTSGVSSRAAAAATTTSAHDDDHDGDDHSHSHAAGTAKAGPSPTESYGCEPHGDHYHCDGARATTSGGAASKGAAASTSASGTGSSAPVQTGAAAVGVVPVLGMLAAAAAAAL